jgi:allantoinase
LTCIALFFKLVPVSDENFVTLQVTKASLNFKNKLTPYEGMKLKGQVDKTFLRGELIYSCNSGFEGLAPIGKLL